MVYVNLLFDKSFERRILVKLWTNYSPFPRARKVIGTDGFTHFGPI